MVVTRTKKIGQILIETGAISSEQLELALKEQKQTGEKLGQILQRLGICSEHEIARVLASQAGVSFVSTRNGSPRKPSICCPATTPNSTVSFP
jgi:hypothetical protein